MTSESDCSFSNYSQIRSMDHRIMVQFNVMVNGSIHLLAQYLAGPDAELLSGLNCTELHCVAFLSCHLTGYIIPTRAERAAPNLAPDSIHAA